MTPPPPATATRTLERDRVDAPTFAAEIMAQDAPVVLRGQAAHWPAVHAATGGARAIADYLTRFDGGKPLEVMVGPPEIGGRFFYRDDMHGFNFGRQMVPLAPFVRELLRLAEAREARPSALYANAAAAPDHLPGWREANGLDLAPVGAVPRLWIGNATVVATHFDTSANVATCVAGRRRFTLFPPDQVVNLYLGPLDNSLAGPPNSMVDPEAPDLDRYPRFATALAQAQVAELAPGDALFIPPNWWHHVRALDPLNVLVNYWWPYDPAATPFLALIHAMRSVRDLPAAERRTWRTWFDHFVFADDAAEAAAHLPEHARGVAGAPGPERAERMRRFLLHALGRGGSGPPS